MYIGVEKTLGLILKENKYVPLLTTVTVYSSHKRNIFNTPTIEESKYYRPFYIPGKGGSDR